MSASGPSERPLPLAPPPWTCKSTTFVLSHYHSASTDLPLDIVFDPLELHAPSFSSEKETGKYVGGLGCTQIIRYSETPVGTYDELVILPGFFSHVGSDGKKRKDARVTGIWVSQETTLMNGRKNWNLPKYAMPTRLVLRKEYAKMSIVLQESRPLQLHPYNRIKRLPYRSQGLSGGPQRDSAFFLRHNPPYKLPPRLPNK